MKRNHILRTILSTLLCLMMVVPSMADVLKLPSGTKVIEDYAFYGDTSLDEVVLPEGIEEIGDYAFAESGLTKINLPSTLENIADNALDKDKNIEVTATKGTEAYNWAVDNEFINENPESPTEWFEFTDNSDGKTCTLTKYIGVADNSSDIIIPSHDSHGHTVTSIGQFAFNSCSGLSGRLVIPNTVIYINNYAFFECSGFGGDLIIPDSVKIVGEFAFYDCCGFTGSLGLPNHEIDIRESAFSHCSGFTGNLIIPNGVKYLGGSAFLGCSGFTGDLVIPDSVIMIGNHAFYNCTGFNGNLVLSKNISLIDVYSFYGCAGLTGKLIIPDNVTKIREAAFQNCSGFTRLSLPQKLTSIENSAFCDCSSLSGNLIIPESVTSIGHNAFANCSSYTGDLIIPNKITEIQDGTFYGCSSLNGRLILPDGLITIQSGAFEKCSGLVGHLIIPSTVTSIGGYAFAYCSGFYGELIIPDSVVVIDNSAFYKCTGFFGNLVIPEQVTQLGFCAFYETNIESVILMGTNTDLFTETFGNCAKLKSIYCINPSQSWTILSQIERLAKKLIAMDAAVNPFESDQEDDLCLSGAFVDDDITLNQGETIIPEGTVISTGKDIYRVYLCLEGYGIIGQSSVSNYETIGTQFSLANKTAFTLKTTVYPFNHAGTYRITLHASTNYGEGVVLDELMLNVIEDKSSLEATVNGSLIKEDNSPIPDVAVRFYDDSILAASTVSGEDGKWTVSGLIIGKLYRMVIESPIYMFSEMDIRITQNNQRIQAQTGQPRDSYLITKEKNIKAAATANACDVKIQSNLEWSLTTDEDWIHPSMSSGTGDADITLTIDENPIDAVRIGSICLEAANRSWILPVAQLGTTKFRLQDPDIINPAENNLMLDLGAITVEWTEVPNADHYVVSLRDLDTDNLIVNHSVRSRDGQPYTILTPEYFDYGRNYRVAVGAVPKGFESSDTLVSWKERVFSVSAAPVNEETWLYGRVMEYASNGSLIPVEGATLELYPNEENTNPDETATPLAIVQSEDDGTWVFHNLTQSADYIVIVTARPEPETPKRLLRGPISYSAQPLGTIYAGTVIDGGNYVGDIVINGYDLDKTQKHGLWAKIYNYADVNKFDDESLRYVRTVSTIDFTFTSSNDMVGNKLIRAGNYATNAGVEDFAYYTSLEKLGMVFTGHIYLPENLGTTEIMLTGDDGISLRIGTNTVPKWSDAYWGHHHVTQTLDTTKGNVYPLEIKYYNGTGEAKLVLQYRYKIGNRWSAWLVVPENWLYLGNTPTINPTLSFWDTRQTVQKLNKSLDNYVNVSCAKFISNYAMKRTLSGIGEYAEKAGVGYGGRDGLFSQFGRVAHTKIGSNILNSLGLFLGASLDSTLTDAQKEREIKNAVLKKCNLQFSDEDDLQLDIDWEDGINAVIGILTFLEEHNVKTQPYTAFLDNILLYDINPFTHEAYDPTNPAGESVTLSTIVESFFKEYKFAKALSDMFHNAVEKAKEFNDTDRMKSFIFLNYWNQYHGITIDPNLQSFVSTLRATNSNISNYTNYETGDAGSNVSLYENVRNMELVSLTESFENETKNYFGGTSYMESIYKQLLLDCMDCYTKYAFELPDEIEWPHQYEVSDVIAPPSLEPFNY